MTEKQKNVQSLVEREKEIILKLRQNKKQCLEQAAESLPDMVNIFQELFAFALADRKSEGIEIPIDILEQQLENLEHFYCQRDIVQLADTLEYEMLESVYFYLEILKTMRQN